jgi:hypothetical protein
MKTRYCGDNTIELEYVDKEGDRLRFKGRVINGTDWWEFDNVLVDRPEPSEKAYDIAASGAVHYASLYGSNYDPSSVGGEIPDWAPPSDFADRVNDALDFEPEGYYIQREIDGPATYIG